jgi:hypothetical protein
MVLYLAVTDVGGAVGAVTRGRAGIATPAAAHASAELSFCTAAVRSPGGMAGGVTQGYPHCAVSRPWTQLSAA